MCPFQSDDLKICTLFPAVERRHSGTRPFVERIMTDHRWTPQALSQLKTTLLQDYSTVYDFDHIYDTGTLVRLNNHPHVYYWQSENVLKLGGTKYEMNMIHLAGDCAVTMMGPVVQDGNHLGFLMKRERPLDDACRLSESAKRSIMYMMKSVVDDLHMQKGIVHGDLKLANMLQCSDGKVRLCDFAGAFLIHDPGPLPSINTTSWLSPYRALHPNESPTVEDDLFALGVSVWELFTGKRPFEGLKGNAAGELIRNGKTINVDEIKDEEACKVVKKMMSGMLMRGDSQ